jgi:hypothetical protein
MNGVSTRPWWRRKRVLLPLTLLILLAATFALAVARSNVSRIIVYNETGADVAGLHLSACGQTRNFQSIPAEGSVRWKLAPQGNGSEIVLELATQPPVRWQGEHLDPQGGYVVTLRLWPEGQVEAHRQILFWQRMLKGAPDLNE